MLARRTRREGVHDGPRRGKWTAATRPAIPERAGQIGFVEARKLKPHDRYVLPDEWD
jgi:hypothetical protein